ncbi:dTMP kinase [Tuwongella immobilis]|uniref:Thymidylate kinase n=1 Tax=Tuwongella immobilis TaxID=692036 RepID=A0A6C2YPB0_9BACT|nr:dTMP kinase [Tuwongella immobilis]VIP03131.1 thymidylate kinase : Thymidylate kinase OS=Pirellula staleyi (strain ATCC 27377 / DSM 6068 / ICPB 4128) GN=tmk PE=3 SV=1: Thymidylate_kin [Tuwongella immobilis]VTS03481.1 thymidylate kinase : Thymidylate kinase OS=Pirellula staleyi (strain ATCC 27377 / DSM 6068 / ICPB 4128) GN=tmk PE=3 SV=1: Thymidylate_kin [Tuwongella immobilis]
MFFSLDGLDGTGKSTQCRLLVDWLNATGYPATGCIDPGGTELGAKIRSLLLDNRQQMHVRTEALLFMASRAELVETVIRPALEAGRIVISDRYLLANVVYQGHAGDLDPDALWSIGSFSTHGMNPDHIFLLDLPSDQAHQRLVRPHDRMEAKGSTFRERVRQGFLREASRRPDQITIVDASAEIDVVFANLQQLIRPFLER